MTKTCGAVGVGLSVGVGGAVAGDSVGKGDGVVVATGADAHDTARATTTASRMRGERIVLNILAVRSRANGQASKTTSWRVVARQGRPRQRSGGSAAAPRVRTQRRTRISRSARVTRPRFCSQIARSVRIASSAAFASMTRCSSFQSPHSTLSATAQVMCRIRFVPCAKRRHGACQRRCDAGDIRIGSGRRSAGAGGLRH